MRRDLIQLTIFASLALGVYVLQHNLRATEESEPVAAMEPPVTQPPPPPRDYRLVRVFVALCDNANQGIVRVPAALGNGQDPRNNLYWGAQFGLKTFFKASPHWTVIDNEEEPTRPAILERITFATNPSLRVVADAYDGAHMGGALRDFPRTGEQYGHHSVADCTSALMNAPSMGCRRPPNTFQLLIMPTRSWSGMTTRYCPPNPSPAHTSTPSVSIRHH